MVQNNGDVTAKECQSVMKYLFLRETWLKGKNCDMLVTSCGKRPSFSTVKNWVARFRTQHLRTEDEHSGRPTQVTVPGNVDVIYSMILEDLRISDKKIAENLAMSQERVGYNIYKFVGMRKLSAKWVPKCISAN
jgi:transposase